MTEWLKVTVLKTVVPATVPRVRIPLSPPRIATPAGVVLRGGGAGLENPYFA